MSNDLLTEVASDLLAPAGLQTSDLDRLIGQLAGGAIDAADIYFQRGQLESWSMENGIVKEGAFHIEQGAGLRAISGEKTGFAYSEDLSLAQLTDAAQAARAIARIGDDGTLALPSAGSAITRYEPVDVLNSISQEEKIALIQRVEAVARQADSRVKEVFVNLVGAHDTVMIASSETGLSADVRPLVRINVTVVVEQNGRRETGSSGGGARSGYQY
ncbi:MAG: PmbA/TldA family metallopeptidase, partial [Oceanobacter sp.]